MTSKTNPVPPENTVIFDPPRSEPRTQAGRFLARAYSQSPSIVKDILRTEAEERRHVIEQVKKRLRAAVFPDPVRVLGGEPLVLILAIENILDEVECARSSEPSYPGGVIAEDYEGE